MEQEYYAAGSSVWRSTGAEGVVFVERYRNPGEAGMAAERLNKAAEKAPKAPRQ